MRKKGEEIKCHTLNHRSALKTIIYIYYILKQKCQVLTIDNRFNSQLFSFRYLLISRPHFKPSTNPRKLASRKITIMSVKKKSYSQL
uniref:Ovule protein n=1 Tax=Heterorhabditis bacteriophora TaxID=37862 RepID=A0A1I7WG07_HETBA